MPSSHGDGTGDGSSHSASPDASPPFGGCPADRPNAGDPCVQVDQGCAYVMGSSCAAFVCDGSGHWQSSSVGC
jgi:hypothetical protein